jgi:protein tyrosine/serine phosphatase
LTSGEARDVRGGPATLIDENSGEVKASLPLFHRVDLDYMRGAVPAREGPDLLLKLGVKTIVDLRSSYDRTPGLAAEAERVGLGYQWLPLSVWDPPTDAQTAEFLAVVTDKSLTPVFVICADGLNRTGEMTAIYRMAHDQWSVDEAIKEMDDAGFSPYYYSLRNYVWSYARSHGLKRVETSRR